MFAIPKEPSIIWLSLLACLILIYFVLQNFYVLFLKKEKIVKNIKSESVILVLGVIAFLIIIFDSTRSLARAFTDLSSSNALEVSSPIYYNALGTMYSRISLGLIILLVSILSWFIFWTKSKALENLNKKLAK
jgi:hypothetical protein